MNEIIYGIFKVQYDFALEVWFSIFWHFLKQQTIISVVQEVLNA